MADPQLDVTLEDFAAVVGEVLANDVPEGAHGVFVVDDGDDVMVMEIPDLDTEATEMANRMAVGRRFLALATRSMYSETWDGKSWPAWVATCVEANRPAWFMVKQDRQRLWTLLNPPDSPPPWFLLSTAASLRKNLQTGKPLVLKGTNDERLMRNPQQVPDPPVDETGRL